MVLNAELEELRALNEQQERFLHEFAPLDINSCNTKGTQWISTAPTKRSTVIGSDTSSKIISTSTATSTQ